MVLAPSNYYANVVDCFLSWVFLAISTCYGSGMGLATSRFYVGGVGGSGHPELFF